MKRTPPFEVGIKCNHQSGYTGDSTARMHDTVIRFTTRHAYLLLVPQGRACMRVYGPDCWSGYKCKRFVKLAPDFAKFMRHRNIREICIKAVAFFLYHTLLLAITNVKGSVFLKRTES